VADFLEIYGLYDEVAAREQASRCVQCPEPTCVAGCPLGVHIPEWLALTAEGNFREAATVLQSTSSLPELCARVCPADHLCEALCVINGRTQPVSVWAVEQFLNEYAFAHGIAAATATEPNGLRVAVIGAGPGGLACADQLAKRGYRVTVFDSRLQPGGLLVYGTPAFRLERTILQRRIEILQQMDVQFRLGVTVGRDVNLDELRAHHDAIYLGFPAKKARTLDVPGVTLPSVHQALPFIVQDNLNAAPDTPRIDVTGKGVVVIGGGDTAIDCLRTAVRSGARQVTGVYRRDEESMPCSIRELENATEEGVRYVFQASPIAVLGNDLGTVRGVRFQRTQLGEPDAEKRRPFAPQPGTEFELEADCVFLALGFEREPLPADSPFHDLTVNPQGAIVVDANHMTSMAGIFAGGDLVRGPTTALHAVRDARRAAVGIHQFCAEITRTHFIAAKGG
jgi:glutamate synthase (NADPH/NADH) small chain